MDWRYLYNLQRKLDARIKQEHKLLKQDVFSDKILALYVELGELANETRCFKFWSNKKASEHEVILEEFVDGIHFILSLGIEKDLYFIDEKKEASVSKNLTNIFNEVFHFIYQFSQEQNDSTYQQLFLSYLALGNKLGFSNKEIYQAYLEKNEVNHQRQDDGY